MGCVSIIHPGQSKSSDIARISLHKTFTHSNLYMPCVKKPNCASLRLAKLHKMMRNELNSGGFEEFVIPLAANVRYF